MSVNFFSSFLCDVIDVDDREICVLSIFRGYPSLVSERNLIWNMYFTFSAFHNDREMCTLRMNGWSMAVTTVRPWRPGLPSWIDRWTKWKRSSPRPTVRRQTNRSLIGGSFSSSARRCSATMGETNGILHSIDSRSSSAVLCKCCICNYRIVISGIDKVLFCWIECYDRANEWYIALKIRSKRQINSALKKFSNFFLSK